MRRTPKRSDGKRTLENLLKSALELFAKHGYYGVSIPMIARKANVKTATFYQYFTDKEAIYKKLLSEAFYLFENYLQASYNQSVKHRISNFVQNYFAFFIENPHYYRILHEAVYLRRIALKKIEKILDYAVSHICPASDFVDQMVLRWFVTGPTRFIAIYNSLSSNYRIEGKVIEELVDFTLHGIDSNEHKLSEEVFQIDVKPVVVETTTTRLKLLQAAEKLFGSRGYRNTLVSDIAKVAKVASGTVYVHFQSKEQILEELVTSTNRNFRLTLSTTIRKFQDRRDAEIAGYFTFLKFFNLHPDMYLIVRQAEFFNPEISMNYYMKILQSYIPPLEKAISNGQLRNFTPQNLALILMGIGHFMGEDLVVQHRVKDHEIVTYLERLASYLYKGLNSKEREKLSLNEQTK